MRWSFYKLLISLDEVHLLFPTESKRQERNCDVYNQSHNIRLNVQSDRFSSSWKEMHYTIYHYMLRNWLWLATGLHQHISTTQDKNCKIWEGQLRYFGEYNEKKQESLYRKLQNTKLHWCMWFSKQNVTEI